MRSDKGKTVIAALMMAVLIIVSYFVIVYGMLRGQIEDMVRNNSAYGLSNYYDLANYESAAKNFRKALFLEKYIVFWDKNESLPQCYQNMALGLEGLQEFEKAADMYERAISAYEKYQPEDDETVMNIHTKISLIYSILGNNNKVIEHAGIANDYYQALDQKEQPIDAGTAAMELANGYYNTGDYERAAVYFEIAIPIIYNNLNWGIGDAVGPEALAIIYRLAADAYGKSGNEEMRSYYQEKYDDLVWVREISDDVIDEYMRMFHWGMD